MMRMRTQRGGVQGRRERDTSKDLSKGSVDRSAVGDNRNANGTRPAVRLRTMQSPSATLR